MNNTNPKKTQRRSIRLKQYDYSRPGAYFVTICTHNREPIFGNIINGKMELSLYGKIVSTRWRNLRRRHKNMDLGAFVVMPNHFHGIIVIRSGAKRDAVPDIIRGFKTFSARRINQERGTPGNPVWQRNYWEHVIRDQDSFRRIHDYISTNPLRWHLDRENPRREGEDSFDRWLDSLGGQVSWVGERLVGIVSLCLITTGTEQDERNLPLHEWLDDLGGQVSWVGGCLLGIVSLCLVTADIEQDERNLPLQEWLDDLGGQVSWVGGCLLGIVSLSLVTADIEQDERNLPLQEWLDSLGGQVSWVGGYLLGIVSLSLVTTDAE